MIQHSSIPRKLDQIDMVDFDLELKKWVDSGYDVIDIFDEEKDATALQKAIDQNRLLLKGHEIEDLIVIRLYCPGKVYSAILAKPTNIDFESDLPLTKIQSALMQTIQIPQ